MNQSLGQNVARQLLRDAALPYYRAALPRLREFVPDAPDPDALWEADADMMGQLWEAALLLHDTKLASFLYFEAPGQEES